MSFSGSLDPQKTWGSVSGKCRHDAHTSSCGDHKENPFCNRILGRGRKFQLSLEFYNLVAVLGELALCVLVLCGCMAETASSSVTGLALNLWSYCLSLLSAGSINVSQHIAGVCSRMPHYSKSKDLKLRRQCNTVSSETRNAPALFWKTPEFWGVYIYTQTSQNTAQRNKGLWLQKTNKHKILHLQYLRK